MSKLEFGCVEHLRWIRKHMAPQDDEHKVKTCPFCGKEPATRAGFAICINDDCEQSNYWSGLDIDEWNTRPIEDALNARIAELSQAVGLITTLKPTMVMDADHPLEMAKEVAEYVTARIAELEAERRWIPVSERLPEDMTEVLVLHGLCVTTANYYHYRGLLSKHGWYQIDGMKLGVSWATHWMPLPKPPEVKE